MTIAGNPNYVGVPRWPFRLDTSHPYYPYIKRAVVLVGRQTVELVSGTPTTLTEAAAGDIEIIGSGHYGGGNFGQGLYFDNGAAGLVEYLTIPGLPQLTEFTLAVGAGGNTPGSLTYHHLVTDSDLFSGSQYNFALCMRAASPLQFVVGTRPSGGSLIAGVAATSALLDDDTPQNLGACFTSGDFRLFLNGAQIGSDTDTGTPGFSGNDIRIGAAHAHTSSSRSWDGPMHYVYILEGFHPQFLEIIGRDPYQILAPTRSRVFLPAAAPGGATLSVNLVSGGGLAGRGGLAGVGGGLAG